jgi:hypothetical protein
MLLCLGPAMYQTANHCLKEKDGKRAYVEVIAKLDIRIY